MNSAKFSIFAGLLLPMYTANAGGRLVLHIMAALAEFERSLIRERTQAGLQAAKRRGRRLGRRPALTSRQVEQAERLIKSGKSRAKIAQGLGVARSTLYRALERRPQNHSQPLSV